MKSSIKVNCPTCTTEVPWHVDSTYRPFCSERCKLIDLGAWADEKHVISEQANEFQDEDLP